MKLAQLVLGPAAVGKSTYCEALNDHLRTGGKPVHVVNLDPAAEQFYYPVSGDIRDLISVDDVTDALIMGPNGALVYCMEYFESNMNDWLDEIMEGFGDDDYVLFDCPGQIELFANTSVYHSFVDYLTRDGWTVCGAFCLDSHFMVDISKFVSGCFQALIAMVTLAIPHVNILTKMDLCEDKGSIDRFLNFSKDELLTSLRSETGSKFRKMNNAVAELIEEFNLVSFIPLDITNVDSLQHVVIAINQATQFGEDNDFKPRDFDTL